MSRGAVDPVLVDAATEDAALVPAQIQRWEAGVREAELVARQGAGRPA